ncbi:hypothetical protein JTE90_009636 [Oedothorax gibbosus]|uniref:Uncharacterized protein n=1 Tax=Oedothorax gibbosus TaxID=931172 RepID=A0AAV6VCN5_9ARAC|nr:hypothetical protein JTE90_009636 [Oedothorax gibbosus]
MKMEKIPKTQMLEKKNVTPLGEKEKSDDLKARTEVASDMTEMWLASVPRHKTENIRDRYIRGVLQVKRVKQRVWDDGRQRGLRIRNIWLVVIARDKAVSQDQDASCPSPS